MTVLDQIARAIGYVVLTAGAVFVGVAATWVLAWTVGRWVVRWIFILWNRSAYRPAGYLRWPRFWRKAPGDWPKISCDSDAYRRSLRQPWKWAVYRRRRSRT